MKITYVRNLCLALFLGACCGEKTIDTSPSKALASQLQHLTEFRVSAEKNDDLEFFLASYSDQAISMPEYQPTLTGINEIKAFYSVIFQRQNVKTFKKEINEIIDLGSTVIEFGTFKKEYSSPDVDTLLIQNGKYCNVWEVQSEEGLKLKGEAFGFFHPVDDPEALTVQLDNALAGKFYQDQKVPLQLRAYNALNEKYVQMRAGDLRSEFYDEEAKFMPFAEPTVSGIDEIKPYLTEYSSRGEVTIDSIAVYTYHHERFDNYILEYSKFKVKWSVPGYSGRTEGKGIRVWKRQADYSFKMFRQIGMHNFIP